MGIESLEAAYGIQINGDCPSGGGRGVSAGKGSAHQREPTGDVFAPNAAELALMAQDRTSSAPMGDLEEALHGASVGFTTGFIIAAVGGLMLEGGSAGNIIVGEIAWGLIGAALGAAVALSIRNG